MLPRSMRLMFASVYANDRLNATGSEWWKDRLDAIEDERANILRFAFDGREVMDEQTRREFVKFRIASIPYHRLD